MNSFFEKVEAEIYPMYDAAIIDENGIQYWKNPTCNFCNNGHSSTKFFIATAIGILEEQGKLSRYDSVTKFFTKEQLPEDYDKKWDEVTVEDAMRHKTGMDTIPYGVDEDNDQEKIGNDYLRYVFSLSIEKQHGEYRRYSDAAYYLLSRIISSAAGENCEEFLRKNIMNPLHFRQWAIAKCPMGYPIGGGGFYARADDVAKLGYAYACGGDYNGTHIIGKDWIRDAMAKDYACSEFRDTGIFVKTGAKGQMVAFSIEKKAAVSWRGYSNEGNDRNNRLLEAFDEYLKTKD